MRLTRFGAPRRIRFRALAVVVVAEVAACGFAVGAPPTPVTSSQAVSTPREGDLEVLAFEVVEGNVESHFYRRGPVAAHVLATSGHSPRFVVAFPAGNAGVGVWFERRSEPCDLDVGDVVGVERPKGMRGVTVEVTGSCGTLAVRRAVLGSIRLLRDYANGGEVPTEVVHELSRGPPLVYSRTTLDGEHHIRLAIEPQRGSSARVDPDQVVELTARSGTLRLRMTVLSDESPLTPIPSGALLRSDVPASVNELRALAFLAYEEKLLAGSWRFLTYFGRDTLLSLRLLMPALQPWVIEAGLRAVVERLSPAGQVAHEEDIGDWAALRHLRAGRRNSRSPIYDYKMIDDDFLLAPVAALYLLDTEDGAARAEAFLAQRSASGLTFREALRRNLTFVLRRARRFAASPSPRTLISLQESQQVGDWRDSREGLGGGRIPFSVNAALVPAALEACARLLASPLFGPDAATAAEARRLAGAWQRAREFFRVEVPEAVANERLRAYANEQELEALPVTGPVVFPALALDEAGVPIPVMHSDEGFALLFTEPAPDALRGTAERILRPFPAGLRTPVGIVVANPVYAADPELRARFTRHHYHGTVVWSWQQAMLAAGLRRQIERDDLPTPTRQILRRAERVLWAAIESTRSARTSELWSWTVENGDFRRVPFGQGSGHRTESNPVQLWSTVFLAVRAPPD